MAAANSDLFRKGGANTVTTLAAPGKALAATSITVGSTTNYPTDTGIVIGIRQVDSDGVLVPGTYSEYNATVTSGTTFSIDAVPVLGSDQVYPAGSTTQVFLPVSSSAHNDLIDGLVVSHNQDGTLKAGAVDNAAVLASNVVETPKIKDVAVTPPKLSTSPVGFGLQEIARTTLSSASDTITVSSIPAKKHLKIIIAMIATGGTIDTSFRFNNDSSGVYKMQYNVSNTPSNSVNTGVVTSLPIETGMTTSSNASLAIIDLYNPSTSYKVGNLVTSSYDSDMYWLRGAIRYALTTQVTRIDVTNAGTGDFAIGSEIIVLGTD